MIKNAPAWKWANNSFVLEDVNAALQKLNDEVTANSFSQMFLTESFRVVKTAYPDEGTLTKEAANMSHALDPLVNAVSRETAKLVNMHGARQK